MLQSFSGTPRGPPVGGILEPLDTWLPVVLSPLEIEAAIEGVVATNSRLSIGEQSNVILWALMIGILFACAVAIGGPLAYPGYPLALFYFRLYSHALACGIASCAFLYGLFHSYKKPWQLIAHDGVLMFHAGRMLWQNSLPRES